MNMLKCVLLLLLSALSTIKGDEESLQCAFYDQERCFNWIRGNYKICHICRFENVTMNSFNINIPIDSNNNNVSNTEVIRVEFSGGQVNSIPENIFIEFPDLAYLGMKATNTTHLEKEFFTNAGHLKVFDCEKNFIKSLGANLFENAENLEVIDLDGNQIEEIDSDAFRHLTKLYGLVLSRNKLIKIDPLWFQDTTHLNQLEIIDNQIQDLHGRVFRRLRTVKKIQLSKNKIRKLDKFSFQDNGKLEVIDLSFNKLEDIPPRLFANLTKLKSLNLQQNICIDARFDYQRARKKFIEEALEGCKPVGRFGKVLDACEIPAIANGRIVNSYDDATEIVGALYSDYDFVNVICNANYSLLSSGLGGNQISCIDEQWNKPFPDCIKLCNPSEIQGQTINTICMHDETAVFSSCKNIIPGTIAQISCKTGYKKYEHHPGEVRCLESGNWDREVFKCEPDCGKITPQVILHVYGGYKADITEVPWQVGIYRNNSHICGGSIISEKIVISAAHCYFIDISQVLEKLDASIFKVAAGKYFRDLNARERFTPQIMQVQEILTPTSYNGFESYYLADIAVVILEAYLIYEPHILPVCLEFSAVSVIVEGTISLVAGWGLNEAGLSSDNLKKINMPVVDLKTCRDKAPSDYKAMIIDDKLCAGLGDESGACTGDSGGGMAISRKINDEEIFFLEGVVSNGRSSEHGCDLSFYNVLTNVQKYSNFIKQALKDNVLK